MCVCVPLLFQLTAWLNHRTAFFFFFCQPQFVKRNVNKLCVQSGLLWQTFNGTLLPLTETPNIMIIQTQTADELFGG